MFGKKKNNNNNTQTDLLKIVSQNIMFEFIKYLKKKKKKCTVYLF
jgi:hypothetical protein